MAKRAREEKMRDGQRMAKRAGYEKKKEDRNDGSRPVFISYGGMARATLEC
jgi:hypothetical protein